MGRSDCETIQNAATRLEAELIEHLRWRDYFAGVLGEIARVAEEWRNSGQNTVSYRKPWLEPWPWGTTLPRRPPGTRSDVGLGSVNRHVSDAAIRPLIPRQTMNKHHITLTADESRRVLALQPGETMTMTMTRAFDPQPPRSFVSVDPKLLCDGRFGWIKHRRCFAIHESPLGQQGDVLVHSYIDVTNPREPIISTLDLTVVSVTPRLDGQTWVVDAEVRKET